MQENYLGTTTLNKTSSYLVRSNNRRDPEAEIVRNPRVKVVTGLHCVMNKKHRKRYTNLLNLGTISAVNNIKNINKTFNLCPLQIGMWREDSDSKTKKIEEGKTKVVFYRYFPFQAMTGTSLTNLNLFSFYTWQPYLGDLCSRRFARGDTFGYFLECQVASFYLWNKMISRLFYPYGY